MNTNRKYLSLKCSKWVNEYLNVLLLVMSPSSAMLLYVKHYDNPFSPDMLAPAMIPVQLVNMTANTVEKDMTELVL